MTSTDMYLPNLSSKTGDIFDDVTKGDTLKVGVDAVGVHVRALFFTKRRHIVGS